MPFVYIGEVFYFAQTGECELKQAQLIFISLASLFNIFCVSQQPNRELFSPGTTSRPKKVVDINNSASACKSNYNNSGHLVGLNAPTIFLCRQGEKNDIAQPRFIFFTYVHFCIKIPSVYSVI